MAGKAFEYSNGLLSECADSQLAARVVGDDWDNDSPSLPDESCRHLYMQYINHFGKTLIEESDNESRNLQISASLANFIRNVKFVAEHNSGAAHPFLVSLNRFSDQDVSSFLPSETNGQIYGDDEYHRILTRRKTERVLSDALGIETTPLMEIGRGSFSHLSPKINKHYRKRIYDDLANARIFIPSGNTGPFDTPTVPANAVGDLTTVKRNKLYGRHDTSLTQDAHYSEDGFMYKLNWATTENPDGMAIVHDPINQGLCGSCWAVAATGSLEASATRRVAAATYRSYISSYGEYYNNTYDDIAIVAAQKAAKVAFGELNLSIQELVDCDTEADQGCVGGNPMLAFYFIHKHGLTSTDDYSYTERQQACNRDSVSSPRASVASWGVIATDHENHMELALRYIGPIAVGINAGDPSFMLYRGGIFDSSSCRQHANHALLLVGYDEEIDSYGNTVRFWIARNSWGTDWGEDGYVRIARRGGQKGIKGVCGIARNPSVALGGFIIGDFGFNDTSFRRSHDVAPMTYSWRERICLGLGQGLDGSCGKILGEIHDHSASILALCGLALCFSAIWSLFSDCRRRRRHKLARDRRRRTGGRNNPDVSSENVALLRGNRINGEPVDYGT